ncbi:MAG: cytochrome c-type biogenesis protein CcmH [Endozoicomonadaceae bacterium]|nr:cytochrome c-type biogenesis protein CcmH [Endozoicomonadaceae bacterium]
MPANATLDSKQLNSSQQSSYHSLTHELRCPSCPNQSLADSHSMIALDLKKVIIQQLKDKKDEKIIRKNLVSQYGPSIEYRPPVNKKTWFLWFSPFILICIGIICIIRIRRRHHVRGAYD